MTTPGLQAPPRFLSPSPSSSSSPISIHPIIHHLRSLSSSPPSHQPLSVSHRGHLCPFICPPSESLSLLLNPPSPTLSLCLPSPHTYSPPGLVPFHHPFFPTPFSSSGADLLLNVPASQAHFTMSQLQQDQFIEHAEEPETCPLCVEELDLTDQNFKPCPCGYQVCSMPSSPPLFLCHQAPVC